MRLLRLPPARFSYLSVALGASLLGVLPAAAQEASPPRPMISVQGGPPGTEVFVTVLGGLPSYGRVSLGFGGLASGYQLLERPETGPDGLLFASVTVPEWAEPDGVYFFFLNLGGGLRVLSDPFIVTDADGALQVTGTVSEAAEGCVLISGPGSTLYALGGVAVPPAIGARVTVDGNLGPLNAAALSEASPCAAEAVIPVTVREIRGAGIER